MQDRLQHSFLQCLGRQRKKSKTGIRRRRKRKTRIRRRRKRKTSITRWRSKIKKMRTENVGRIWT